MTLLNYLIYQIMDYSLIHINLIIINQLVNPDSFCPEAPISRLNQALLPKCCLFLWPRARRAHPNPCPVISVLKMLGKNPTPLVYPQFLYEK